MEKLDVFDCSNVFIASFFTDDRGCAHCNREHTLIYIHSGELEICFDVGFKNLSHFSKLYKEMYGMAPTFS